MTQTCTQCGETMGDTFTACWNCGGDLGPATDAVPPPLPALPSCSGCGERLQHMASVPLRTGGPDSGWQLFREWSELDEELWHVEVWRCPRCRRLAFFEPPDDE